MDKNTCKNLMCESEKYNISKGHRSEEAATLLGSRFENVHYKDTFVCVQGKNSHLQILQK